MPHTLFVFMFAHCYDEIAEELNPFCPAGSYEAALGFVSRENAVKARAKMLECRGVSVGGIGEVPVVIHPYGIAWVEWLESPCGNEASIVQHVLLQDGYEFLCPDCQEYHIVGAGNLPLCVARCETEPLRGA